MARGYGNFGITVAAAAALCACSSGGDGAATLPIAGAIAAPPLPPPTPGAPGSAPFETAEYNTGFALRQLGASSAYVNGGTGQGITVAVVDTGVDVDHPELVGAMHPGSIDIIAGRNQLDAIDDHGTFIAGILAAARDGSGMHGIAFDARVLSIRADTAPGDDPNDNCSTGTTCGFYGADVAAGIRHAVAQGARVINLSLGGYFEQPEVLEALREATRAGVLVTIASGNDGLNSPAWPALYADAAFTSGLIVAVGSVDQNRDRSSFSNGAAGAIRQFLMAPGEGIFSTTIAGDPTDPATYYATSSGTSFAAPYVAGALALLLDAYPHLSAREALDILFQSAVDMGFGGPDDIYGWGLVDLARAFQPIGGSNVTLKGVDGGPEVLVDAAAALAAPSGAFGDFAYHAGLWTDVLVHDAYDRAFRLNPSVGGLADPLGGAFDAAALGMRLDARSAATPFGHAMFRANETTYAALSNLPTEEVAPALRLGFEFGRFDFAAGRGFAAPAPVGGLASGLLSAGSGLGSVANLAGGGDWASVGFDVGAWRLGVRSANGVAADLDAVSLTRRLGAHRFGVEFGETREARSAFGGVVGARFGGGDATQSSFAAAGWDGPLAYGWRGEARAEAARAELEAGAGFEVRDAPLATAWSVGAARPIGPATLGVSLQQPLRAESGALAANALVGYDRFGTPTYETRVAGLAPSGREVALETTVRLRLGDGAETIVSARVADDAGHVAREELTGAVFLGLRLTR